MIVGSQKPFEEIWDMVKDFKKVLVLVAIPVLPYAMLAAGRRVFFLKRLINYRYGLTSADDALTPRMLEPGNDGEAEGSQVDLEAMKARFYELMDIDPERLEFAQKAVQRIVDMGHYPARSRPPWIGKKNRDF
jgi:aldehyde:ferredoxin oxidoreductase